MAGGPHRRSRCARKGHDQAPLGQALAAVSWALTLMLQAMCLADPAGSSAVEVSEALAEARGGLRAAERHLRRLHEQTADLAGAFDSASVALRLELVAASGSW